MRGCRVRSRVRVLGDRVIVAPPVNLQLAAVPCQDLGLDAGEGVSIA